MAQPALRWLGDRKSGADQAESSLTGSMGFGTKDAGIGRLAELDYLPIQNVRLMLQYTAYNKFNGASTNYDGNGRNASDNNTLFFNVWVAF